MPTPTRSLAPAYAALILAAFSFSTNWIVGRGLSDNMPPAATSFWRWFFATLPILPFAIGPLRRDWPIIRANFRLLVVLSALGVGFFQLFAYWGLRYTLATNGALLNSGLPIFVALISALFYGERMSARVALGVGVSLIGVVTIIVRGDLDTLFALEFNRGDLLIVVAMIIWALYSIRLRERPAGLSTISFMSFSFIVGMLLTGAFFLIELALGHSGNYSPKTWAGLAWLGFVPSLVAYFCWNYGVQRLGAPRAGVFAHLIPVFAATLAMLLLDERPQVYHFVGFALVLLGIWLSARR